MGQYMPIVWIGFAIFMLLCEGFTTQLVSIWFVLGSVCAAITTIFTSDITIQSVVFLAVSLVSLIVTRPLVKRFKKRNKTTGTNADRHIGQVGFMLTDLTDIDETAQAKVGAGDLILRYLCGFKGIFVSYLLFSYEHCHCFI